MNLYRFFLSSLGIFRYHCSKLLVYKKLRCKSIVYRVKRFTTWQIDRTRSKAKLKSLLKFGLIKWKTTYRGWTLKSFAWNMWAWSGVYFAFCVSSFNGNAMLPVLTVSIHFVSLSIDKFEWYHVHLHHHHRLSYFRWVNFL